MSRTNPFVLSIELIVFIALFGGFSLAQGGLYLDTHEVDTYHLLDILFRMELGHKIHVDFVTPIGLFAFLPIVEFMKAGYGVGTSLLLSQIAVAVILLPFVVYVSSTRLSRGAGYAFSFLVLGLVLALAYGEVRTGVSMSMHYNRWAWSLSFVVLAIALLDTKTTPRPVLDGIIVGVISAALLLIKATFFVSLVPVLALAFLMAGRRDALLAALVAGSAALAAVTLVYGVAHWTGYLADLLTVANSTVRPYAGVGLNQLIAGPERVGPFLVVVAAGFLLRGTGHGRAGLLLLLLIPAFLYITFQNFGNDPKWILFVAILLVALRPPKGQFQIRKFDLASVSNALSIAAVALYFPALFPMAISPLTHAAIKSPSFIPMLPAQPDDQDIFMRRDRAHTITAQVHLDRTIESWAKYSEDGQRLPNPTIGGVEINFCDLLAGTRATLIEFTADLQAANIPAGSQILSTGILSQFWLFGPYAPLQNGSPWYYGGLTGLENADYVLVPKCSMASGLIALFSAEFEEAGVELKVVRNNDLYALFEIER